MASIDVSDVITDATFTDRFDVYRQKEIIGLNGRVHTQEQRYLGVFGVVVPALRDGLDSRYRLHRKSNYEVSEKGIVIVTRFTLRNNTVGNQPDQIYWQRNRYLVVSIAPYLNFGEGFIIAQCESLEETDRNFEREMTPRLDFSRLENSFYLGVIPC